MSGYRGRFAPSPTGPLHLGSVAAALVTWLAARQAGGRLLLRVEDLDQPRVVKGMAAEHAENLRWLGLDWDHADGPGNLSSWHQSERLAAYEGAIERLAEGGHLFFCDCSRKEIADLVSAPHGSAVGPLYPGTCREHGLRERAFRRPPAIRIRVPDETVRIADRFQGDYAQSLCRDVGDFVLRRGDGVPVYQLAVVVDDQTQQITEVVRGADLLSSAPQQVFLARLLGGEPPGHAHLPLLCNSDGTRLAKRLGSMALRDHRAAGRSPEEVLGALARLYDLVPGEGAPEPLSAAQLLERADLARLRDRSEVRLPVEGLLPQTSRSSSGQPRERRT